MDWRQTIIFNSDVELQSFGVEIVIYYYCEHERNTVDKEPMTDHKEKKNLYFFSYQDTLKDTETLE